MKKLAFLFSIVSLLNFWSCSSKQNANNKSNAVKNKIDNSKTSETSIGKAKTLVIDSLKAVLYYPDDSYLDSLKRTMDEDSYDNVMMDNDNYSSEAITFFDKRKIPVVQSNASLFIFKAQSGKIYELRKKALKNAFGIILFDTHKEPEVSGLIGVDTFSNHYFSK